MNESFARDRLLDAVDDAAKRCRILLEMAASIETLDDAALEGLSTQVAELSDRARQTTQALGDWRLEARNAKAAL